VDLTTPSPRPPRHRLNQPARKVAGWSLRPRDTDLADYPPFCALCCIKIVPIMSLPSGTCLGPYRIVNSIGAGGMGEVYSARDPRLDRDVAIKVLPPHLACESDAIIRFEREARAVAALSHPNILAIYDVGTHEGVSYLVTELLEGETLRTRLERSPLTWTEAAEVGANVADGLAAAHARGIIHRDLKPANIFLTSDGRVKILDFGLARVQAMPTELSASGTPTETQPGAVMGTVGYMPPEQIRGEKADARSDLFSLGCVLYEMIAGRNPFTRETSIQTLSAILESDPMPLTGSGKDVPFELQQVISRCLQKNPALRMQSARDLSFRLSELLKRDGPIEPRTRYSRFAWLTAALAVALLVAVGLLREGLFGPSGPARIDSLAVLPLENLSGDPAQDFLADGATEALITGLGKIGSLRVIARASVMKYKDTRVPLREIARELRVTALVTGSVLRSGSRVRIGARLLEPETERQIWSDSYERESRDLLALHHDVTRAVASEVLANVATPDEARVAKPRQVRPEAYESYLRARYLAGRTSDADSQASIELAERAIALDTGFAVGYAELATAYIRRIAFVAPDQAGELEMRAYAAAERALSLDPELAEGYLARGELLWTHAHRFAHERSVIEYRRALSLNPNLDQAHRGLARTFVHVGFFEQALHHAARALEINPGNSMALISQSEALLWSGKNEEAMAVLPGIPRLTLPELTEANTAWALFRLGRSKEALSRIHQASQKSPNDTSGTLAGMEAMLVADSNPRRAEDLIRSAAKRRAVNPSHHAAYFIGCAWARMKRASEAVQALREAADTGFPCYPLFASDPNLDSIRQDPLFQALLSDVQKRTDSLRKALLLDRR